MKYHASLVHHIIAEASQGKKWIKYFILLVISIMFSINIVHKPSLSGGLYQTWMAKRWKHFEIHLQYASLLLKVYNNTDLWCAAFLSTIFLFHATVSVIQTSFWKKTPENKIALSILSMNVLNKRLNYLSINHHTSLSIWV